MSIKDSIGPGDDEESNPNSEATEIPELDSLEQIAGRGDSDEQLKFFKDAKLGLNKETKEPSADEKAAMEQGWTADKEAFEKKTGKLWVPAAEFNSRKSFFVKIDTLKKENADIKDRMLKQTAYLQEVEEKAYKRAIDTLTKERDAAIKSGNVEQVHQVEAQIQETHKDMNDKAEKLGVTPTTPNQGIPPETIEFAERNKAWFNQDEENKALVKEAIELEDYWRLKRPELTPGQLIKLVEGDMKHEHPDLFRSRKDEPAAVATQSVRVSAKSPSLASQLTDNQKSIGAELVSRGIYKNIGQYADALKKNRGI